ncbi:hypothetical protein BG004_007322 [Podila humilis]|nr:hypothetical protein BG004_007322 [Podila humilis]
MDGQGVIAYPFLERIRQELNEINRILLTFTFYGTIELKEIPGHLPTFKTSDEEMTRATVTSLRDQREILQEQECALVVASQNRAEMGLLLEKIRKKIADIEKYFLKKRVDNMYPSMPRSIAGYKGKYGEIDVKGLKMHYHNLKDQEFRIALQDMKCAASEQAALAAVPVDHVAAVSQLPEVESLSIQDLPPSFAESQNAYR